jgi:Tfp pilus assembly protein PilF
MTSRSRLGFVAFTCALAFSVALAAPAGAQTMKKGAKAFFEKGATEYNLGHFTEAIVQFEKAYEIDPAPILLFNIGQCHRQSGNKERAVFFYRRYLEQNPKAENRSEVESRIADLDRSLKEEKDLQQRPPTALAPPALAESEGGAPAAAGAASEPPTATLAAPAPAGHADGPAQTVSQSASPPAHAEGGTDVRKIAFWSAVGVGGAGLLLGIIETAVWRSKVSAFDDHTGPSPVSPSMTIKDCGADDPNRGGPGCSGLYDSSQSAHGLAIVGFVVGGLAGAGAAVLYLTQPHGDAHSGVALSCGPGPGGVGVSCGGRF